MASRSSLSFDQFCKLVRVNCDRFVSEPSRVVEIVSGALNLSPNGPKMKELRKLLERGDLSFKALSEIYMPYGIKKIPWRYNKYTCCSLPLTFDQFYNLVNLCLRLYQSVGVPPDKPIVEILSRVFMVKENGTAMHYLGEVARSAWAQSGAMSYDYMCEAYNLIKSEPRLTRRPQRRENNSHSLLLNRKPTYAPKRKEESSQTASATPDVPTAPEAHPLRSAQPASASPDAQPPKPVIPASDAEALDFLGFGEVTF